MMTEWKYLKQIIDQKQVYPQYVEDSGSYFITLYDSGIFIGECIINKNLNLEDKEDFEINYKSQSNANLSNLKDSDGAEYTRLKLAAVGSKAMLDSIEIETSKLSSLYYKNYDLTEIGFASIKFYDSDDVELTTQESIDASCVKTVVDYEPTNNFEIIGGKGIILEIPTTDVRVWVIGVPDIPAQYGGSVQFLRGGLNMRFHKEFHHDGRVPKFMAYDPSLHTNKFRFVFRHEPGTKHKFQIELEIFNP